MSDNNISKLYTDRGGVLWIVTGNGRLCGLNTYSGEFMDSSSYNLNELKVSTICEDSSGVLWIGTYGNGVRMLDKEKKEFTAYGCRFSQDTPFCNYRVICLFADSSGNLWIGTEGSGIGRINTNLKFMSYNSNPDSGIKFSDDVVLSILKDNSGLIWVGTANGGINRFDRENNQVAFYKNNPGDESSISSNTVCSIYEDSKKNLWFGTINGTLSRLDSESGKFVNYNIKNFENTNFTDNGILMIREGRDGILWACAANGGLVRYDTNTGQFTQFTNNPWKPDSISSNHVLSIAEDETGMIWIGTSGGGLNKLDPSSNKFTYYGINEMDSNTQLFNYSINAILNDNGVLWLATDKGLFKFDKNSGESVLVEDAQQTAGTAIFGLLKDNNGNLWLSTINGLVKYYISSDVFKKYNFCEGLHSNQYTSGSYFKGSDGEMFFGGINGFSCFYPEKIRDNSHKPPVVIADLKIFDTLVKIPDTGIVTLSYKDDFISIEFAALDYADPLKNQYAYMLDGFDKDWHYNSTRNYVSYTNLDGGEYVLRVKASNNDGLWNDLETQIKIIIAPPFWETVWFLIAVITFIVLIIVVSVRIRVKALKLKSLEIEQQIIERTRDLNQANEQLRHTDQMKSNFLSMVSHEIRTPLSTLLGFTELIADKIENIIFPNLNVNDSRVKKAMEKIGRDLNIIISEGDRLSVLVNNLLNISKIESGKIDMKNESINIPEIIEQSLLVTKPIVEKAGLSLSVDIEADLPEIVGDRDMLIQVFINLISNAVKYTKEGHIRICAVNSGSSVLFSVEDTGIGIPETHIDKVFDIFYKVESSIANNVGTGNMGLGLSICKQIVEKHGGDIQVKSQYGKGSVFYFTIPVGNGS